MLWTFNSFSICPFYKWELQGVLVAGPLWWWRLLCAGVALFLSEFEFTILCLCQGVKRVFWWHLRCPLINCLPTGYPIICSTIWTKPLDKQNTITYLHWYIEIVCLGLKCTWIFKKNYEIYFKYFSAGTFPGWHYCFI